MHKQWTKSQPLVPYEHGKAENMLWIEAIITRFMQPFRRRIKCQLINDMEENNIAKTTDTEHFNYDDKRNSSTFNMSSISDT